jgi:small-conductance mechanosensitive channel
MNPAPEVVTDAQAVVQSIWNLQIALIRHEPLTVGTVVTAIVLLAVGWWLSQFLSRLIARVLSRRFGVGDSGVAAVKTLGFYVLFGLFAVTSLSMVNFPMTAFTIAGGALAIGVGFGSQNVMNNFISGLILNIERPVRVGDLIQVNDLYGVIERIGARSTRIRASNNTQIILPNSFFLENQVVNFTLTDDIVRLELPVGVVYGSPTREVHRLIHQALDEHERVLKDREPKVIFEDFGDNSLLFIAFFWVRSRTRLEQRGIQSDLRYRIDDLFRAAGIVIAFPQRDVHLDSVRPVEVRIVKEGDHAVP